LYYTDAQNFKKYMSKILTTATHLLASILSNAPLYISQSTNNKSKTNNWDRVLHGTSFRFSLPQAAVPLPSREALSQLHGNKCAQHMGQTNRPTDRQTTVFSHLKI